MQVWQKVMYWVSLPLCLRCFWPLVWQLWSRARPQFHHFRIISSHFSHFRRPFVSLPVFWHFSLVECSRGHARVEVVHPPGCGVSKGKGWKYDESMTKVWRKYDERGCVKVCRMRFESLVEPQNANKQVASSTNWPQNHTFLRSPISCKNLHWLCQEETHKRHEEHIQARGFML